MLNGTAIAVNPSGEKIYFGGVFGTIGKSVEMTFGNNKFQSISGIDIFIVQLDSNEIQLYQTLMTMAILITYLLYQ